MHPSLDLDSLGFWEPYLDEEWLVSLYFYRRSTNADR